MTFHEIQGLWYYFLSIEDDLNNTSKYIEPNGQENCYSFEYYKIITLSCIEIESAFKQICNIIAPNARCGDIRDYKGIILGKYPQIINSMVIVPRWNGKNIFPFKGWDEGKLQWWDDYQKIKHNRFSSLQIATYKNAVYTMAALYILILYLYKINGYDCKGDESAYFDSDYYPRPKYGPQLSELPDFQ